MHSVGNSTFFVRVAAVSTTSKKKGYVIWNAAPGSVPNLLERELSLIAKRNLAIINGDSVKIL